MAQKIGARDNRKVPKIPAQGKGPRTQTSAPKRSNVESDGVTFSPDKSKRFKIPRVHGRTPD